MQRTQKLILQRKHAISVEEYWFQFTVVIKIFNNGSVAHKKMVHKKKSLAVAIKAIADDRWYLWPKLFFNDGCNNGIIVSDS